MCPGEDECSIFQSSAPDQPPEARCPGCPKRSKSEPGAVATGSNDEALIDVIEQLVSDRNSGFGFPDDLTHLERELVILWDRNVAAYERAHQVRVAGMFEAMIGMGGS